MGKTFNTFVDVVHTQADTALSFELEDFHFLLISFIISENHFEGSWLVYCEVSGFVLVTECVSADDDWLLPSGDQPWDVFDDDWFSKNGSVQNVSDCAVG